jgi:hypothetical protein
MQPVSVLRDRYIGETLRAIGSGASLAYLSREQIQAGPVVAINYAAYTIARLDISNTVYSLQKDQVFLNTNFPILSHALESAREKAFGDYVFHCPRDFGLAWDAPSVVVCVDLAKLFGCTAVEYLACDACVTGDILSYDGQKEFRHHYAENYRLHCPLVQERGKQLEIPVSWLATPIPV